MAMTFQVFFDLKAEKITQFRYQKLQILSARQRTSLPESASELNAQWTFVKSLNY